MSGYDFDFQPSTLRRIIRRLMFKDPDLPTYSDWTIVDRVQLMVWGIGQDISSWRMGGTPTLHLPYYFCHRIIGMFR